MSDRINNSKEYKNIAYTLSLLSAVINKKAPKEPSFEPDWGFIYKFTKRHSVDNTIFYAVEKLENKPEPKLLKKWMDGRNKCIHRNMVQRQEYTEICSAFEENNIDYMPVKGFYLSELYPTEDSRYMSDIDILIKDRRDDAVNLLLDKGYSLKKESIDYDKPLIKPPFMVVELHNSLFPKYSQYRVCFEDVFSKSTKKGHCFKMNAEDFYIYELVHLYKHFSGAGTGIRSIIDFYLINKKYLPDLDNEIIHTKLKKLELNYFCDNIARIAEKWFENEVVSSFSDEEIYILSSGVYGTTEHMLKNKSEKYTRNSYMIMRLFPSKSMMQECFPKISERTFVLPFYYFFRLVRGLLFRKKKIINEIKILNKDKKTEA